jgi:hypothetical protein
MRYTVRHEPGAPSAEGGFELLEFIGMMLLVCVIALIVWQFMAYAHQQLVIGNAAREAAREAAVHEKIWGGVDAAVQATCEGFSCSVDAPFECSPGSTVRATVSAPLVVVVIPGVPIPAINVRATGSAMCEELDIGF